MKDVIRLNKSQEDTYQEVYVGDCYRVRHIVKNYDIIIDAGAYICDFARLCLDNGAKSVISIENGDESMSLCIQNCKGYSNWTGYHAFIAPKHVNLDFLDGIGYEKTKFSISDLLRDNADKKILLKMDIEGWEFHALREMEQQNTINIPHYIIGEYHGAMLERWDGSIFKDKPNPDKLTNNIVKEFFASLGREFTFPVMEDDKHYVLGQFESVETK